LADLDKADKSLDSSTTWRSIHLVIEFVVCLQASAFSSQGCSGSVNLEKMLYDARGELCP
jgi:hypothetical protein